MGRQLQEALEIVSVAVVLMMKKCTVLYDCLCSNCPYDEEVYCSM